MASPLPRGDPDLSLGSESQTLAYLRKESLDLYNRLHSIAEDIIFVDQVHAAYPATPILPNLRCGAWYTNPEIAVEVPAYFKSTDGHFSNWSFNLRRGNLHLLSLIAEKHGVILVDSTRSGKRIPDALSKTVPIWCAVVNRAILLRYPHTPTEGWVTSLYTPPGAVSSQEHHQIEQRLDGWAQALATSSFALPQLPLPLRPLWITPATTTFPTVSTAQQFLPVICVSASKQVHQGTERRSSGFAYIQGSGDDHELWGMGLTPELFWRHQVKLLAAGRAQLPEIVSALVSTASPPDSGTPPSPIAKISGRILLCALSDVPTGHRGVPLPGTPISTGPIQGKVAYLLLTSTHYETAPKEAEPGTVLQLELPEGKKGQIHFLQDVLPRSMLYIGARLMEGMIVCIACDTGKDISVGVALAAMQKFFDGNGTLISAGEPNMTPDKKSIRTRLEWIIASRPLANPSRTTLKRVNEFLLSSESFRALSLVQK